MGQTAEGNLLFRRAVSSGPVAAVLTEGQHGLTISSATYDGTQRFSSYDVFGQEPGENANFARVVDPAITGAYRPKASQANDTNAANITEAAKWLVTAELAQAITIPLAVEGWRRPDGKLWAENTLIALTAPSLMIYRPSTLIIKTVQFNRTENQDMTSLSLTIPGAYTGVLPEVYPWDA